MLPISPDAELITQAKAGNQDALAQIYERHAAAIYRYIYFKTGEAELSRDLQADVFVRMLESIDRYEDRGWPISAWLFRIARDRMIDTLRQRNRHPQIAWESWEGSCDSPEQDIAVRLDYEAVQPVLNDLSSEQRQVIMLRFIHDMSVHDVALSMGRSTGAIRSLQHRGLQTLARRLEHQTA